MIIDLDQNEIDTLMTLLRIRRTDIISLATTYNEITEKLLRATKYNINDDQFEIFKALKRHDVTFSTTDKVIATRTISAAYDVSVTSQYGDCYEYQYFDEDKHLSCRIDGDQLKSIFNIIEE